MYRTLSQHYRETFGCKVYKLAIDAGFTCPNRDGTVGVNGCSFCSASGGGDFAERPAAIFRRSWKKLRNILPSPILSLTRRHPPCIFPIRKCGWM